MNKNAIKKFAIEARQKLIDSVTDKAGMLGITEKSCSEPITKGPDFEVYQTVAGTEVTLNKRQCEQRRRLVSQIESRGFEAVVEEVAYTWFNRICAIRFMEVNDYLPNRVRVLSSEKEGKMEPDLVTQAPDVDLDLTAQEKEEIINWKMSGTSEDTDKLYCKLFLKQCHQLHDILPGLFEADSDYMELLFGISYTNKDDILYLLINSETGIPESDFNIKTNDKGVSTGQVEIIGWLYQYYNLEPKNAAFAKNGKINKEEIPAVTQLFTPDWIVRYMVENSLGRIWVEGHQNCGLQNNWKYYIENHEQKYDVDIKIIECHNEYSSLKPEDIKLIDPCMGSGHMLVYAFDILMQIYESVGYSQRDAAKCILEHNLYGLDIDDRAYQLAYFAVMMKARQYNRRILKENVKVHLYSIKESNGINRNHLKFYGGKLSNKEVQVARSQVEELISTFKDAKEYGSILNVKNYDWNLLETFLYNNTADEQITMESLGLENTTKQLKNLIDIGKNLAQKYHVVCTNPPYMASSGMDAKLSKYLKDNYPFSKGDLFAVFIEKCRSFTKKNYYSTLITQQSWMFLASYEKLREKLSDIDMVAILHLGAHAFEELGGEVVQTVAFIMRNTHIPEYISVCDRLVEIDNAQEKEKAYLSGKYRLYSKKSDFELIPAKPYAYWMTEEALKNFKEKNLGSLAEIVSGMTTGNNDVYLKMWTEVNFTNIAFEKKSVSDIDLHMTKWIPYHKGGAMRKWYGNHEYVVNWSRSNEFNRAKTTMTHVYLKPCITWSDISGNSFAGRYCYGGFMFDVKGSCAFANDDNLKLLIAIFNSKVTPLYVEALNPTTTTQVGDLKRIPLIIPCEEVLKNVKKLVMENVEYSKKEWDSYEFSWDFLKHPLVSAQSNSIKKSFEQWDEECDDRFEKMKCNEEVLNQIFIEIYGLQNELNSKVLDKDITLRKADLSREIRSFISYAVGCMFGRYSLDKEKIVFAGGNFEDYYKKVDKILQDENGNAIMDSEGKIIVTSNVYKKIKNNNTWMDTTFEPDLDNCIPITDEEYFSDDIVGRFVEFVKTVYGVEALEENLDFIANALGNKGDTSRDVIRNYFLKDFYTDHLKVYQKRPIYWLFDSGKQNGFKALIYMHRYDADTVGRVRTDYLHRAQKYVETAMQSAQYTIDNASSASEKSKATKAVTKYTKQLAEMKIYDEAIAHIANKRIEIDLDDGVKVNYEKFQGVEVAQEGKKTLKVDLLAKIK